MQLIDKLEYYIRCPEGLQNLGTIFKAQERDILITIRDFEKIRCNTNGKEVKGIENINHDRLVEEIFFKRELEKEISFRLKEQIVCQIDSLLNEGHIEAWMEILTWYQLLKEKDIIINRFWEFPILETMLNGFVEELKLFDYNQSPISVLALHKMKDLTDAYFYIVFMLRRIEYEIDSTEGILEDMMGKKLSLTIIRTILKSAKIFDKQNVEKSIDCWVRYNYE